MQDVRWGIIGCGAIAQTFANSLHALDRGSLVAGASRTPDRAKQFADRYGLERHYPDYQSLVDDPEVDAVYIATTHNFHFENTKLCLEHGKHVLCEKPLTVNARQAAELMALAREKNRFLMEGLWTRFLPSILKLRQLVAGGEIGVVQSVYANFCLGKNVAAEHRLRNIELAGGALLDLGIYPISMADIVFNERPDRVMSSAKMDPETGVDEHSCYLFEYDDGRRAVLSASYSQSAPVEALVCGSGGFIRLPHFLGARELHIHRTDESPEVLEFPYPEGENFKYEIAHAMDCIANGKTESDIIPLSKTLEVMETMDTLRTEWGLCYPGETY